MLCMKVYGEMLPSLAEQGKNHVADGVIAGEHCSKNKGVVKKFGNKADINPAKTPLLESLVIPLCYIYRFAGLYWPSFRSLTIRPWNFWKRL